MSVGKMKIAEDRYQNKLQFSHVDTENSQTIAAGGVAEFAIKTNVRIASTSADTYITVEQSTHTPASGTGMFLAGGDSYHTVINAGEWLGSVAEVNVTPLGDI